LNRAIRTCRAARQAGELLLGLALTVALAVPASAASSARAHVGIDPATQGHLYRRDVIVTANPLASLAGYRVLQAGGSAADAAIAVQAVLGLVEPQSSGLGGGGFITFYDAHRHRVLAYDGRETAPAGATPDMFEDGHAAPLPFFRAVLSGRSCGVPGAIAALARLQREHGRLPWRALFGDAERLAREGFTVSPRLAGMIAAPVPAANTPDARAYFTRPDGRRYRAGDTLRNPAYADTIRLLAEQGPRALYQGRIAADIVARVHSGDLPGTLSLQDLANYHVEETPALCRRWQRLRVCAPPPPAGGVSVLEALLLLAHTDIATRGPRDPVAWAQLAEAERLMYADRERYIADPDFVSVPTTGLLDADYLRQRASLIGDALPATAPAAGTPPGAIALAADHTVEPGGTSEFIIVDAEGNVVSMTSTVESIFGDGRMVDGFFLNNQLTDFSFAARTGEGRAAANAVAAGKRPRSAMSPTLVLDARGHFLATTGSAGGPAIISYVVKTLIGVLDWHLSMQAAIDLPNLVADGPRLATEAGFPDAMRAGLASHGIRLTASMFEGSGIQGVLALADGRLEGAADPRREGMALGD
jgi:gamma-glutamyltranspeptidase/glutathione hydrolase